MVLLYMGQNVLEKRWMANSSIMINFFKLVVCLKNEK